MRLSLPLLSFSEFRICLAIILTVLIVGSVEVKLVTVTAQSLLDKALEVSEPK